MNAPEAAHELLERKRPAVAARRHDFGVEDEGIASWIRPSCSPTRSSLCSRRNKIGRSCAEAISINSLSRLYFCSREPLPLASAICAKLSATSLILSGGRAEASVSGTSAA